KRFSSTIARRLGNMGALTKGDRHAEKAGNLDKYNLESKEGRAALNVVYTRILNGSEIPGLADPTQTLGDMGLLNGSEESKIKDSEKTNIPRFLNRLLSLEVSRQNALFDYFYQTFLETIEHLKANGKIDDGMEDLKADSVSLLEPPKVMFTDALTGAKTLYYKLEIIIPTRPARFEVISKYEGVYFFEHRSTGEFIAVRESRAHTDPETGDRYQMFSVSKPKGHNLFYLKEDELTQKHKPVSRNRAMDWWLAEQAKIPPTEQKTIHLLSGALLPIWKYLKNIQHQALKIIRTTTDDGTRLVGVNISPNVIGEIRRSFGMWEMAAETAEEIIHTVREENISVELLGDVKIRKTRFQGRSILEVVPSTYKQIRELRETGLINIIQNSRSRFFVSEDDIAASETLSEVLKMFPPLHLLKTQEKAVFEQDTRHVDNNDHHPVELPGWLIEPSADEIGAITL
ncbi:MAG: strawberry notch C-terminal domain-containing protein, partial [Acidobacteria bacterium]|nr:strawberry notch C-terminal domain-containing protein [Acidobacteriota bacterium]